MASLMPHGTAKNWYIKDRHPVTRKQEWIDTKYPIIGENEKETKRFRKVAESKLKKHQNNKRQNYSMHKILEERAELKKSVKIGEAVAEYLSKKSRSATIKPETLIDYKRQLKYFADWCGNDKRLGELTYHHLESLRDNIAESRTLSGVDGIFRGIKAFLRWAYAEYETQNLNRIIWRFGELKLAKGKRKPKKRIVTGEEFNLVLGFVDDGYEFGFLCKTYFKFARRTGKRLSEICKGYLDGQVWYYGAKGDDEQAFWLDQDLIQQWLTIQEYVPKDDDGLVSLKDLKRFTNKITYAFTTAMRKVVLHSDPDFLKEFGLTRSDLQDIGRAKTAKLAKRLMYRRYAKMHNLTIKEMSESDKRSAIKRVPSFHSLRHSVVTEMVREKGIEYTRAFIGHSNSKTTEEYTHISQKEVSKRHFEGN